MTGTDRVWLDVVGYEGIYQISNDGMVRSLDRVIVHKNGVANRIKGKDKSLITEKDGYKVFRVSTAGKGKLLKVHRELLKAFRPIANHEKMLVNHISGIKSENTTDNLEWCTSKRNSRHYRNELDHGKYGRSRTVSDDDVVLIVTMFLDGKSLPDLMEEFSVPRHIIDGIVKLKTNKYVILDNFKRSDIELELKRRVEERATRTENRMNMFIEDNKEVIEMFYRWGYGREFFSVACGIPDGWIKKAFKLLKDSDRDMASERIKRVSEKKRLTESINKYCVEHGITREKFDSECKRDYPLRLIMKEFNGTEYEDKL